MCRHPIITCLGARRRNNVNKISSKLDWNRMLGFEQVAANRVAAQEESAKLGAKVGVKLGVKLGVKAGVKAD